MRTNRIQTLESSTISNIKTITITILHLISNMCNASSLSSALDSQTLINTFLFDFHLCMNFLGYHITHSAKQNCSTLFTICMFQPICLKHMFTHRLQLFLEILQGAIHQTSLLLLFSLFSSLTFLH